MPPSPEKNSPFLQVNDLNCSYESCVFFHSHSYPSHLASSNINRPPTSTPTPTPTTATRHHLRTLLSATKLSRQEEQFVFFFLFSFTALSSSLRLDAHLASVFLRQSMMCVCQRHTLLRRRFSYLGQFTNVAPPRPPTKKKKIITGCAGSVYS